MSTPDNRNRFIPFRKSDIVEMCLAVDFDDFEEVIFYCRTEKEVALEQKHLDAAKATLDRIWDNYFAYAK